MTSTFWSTMINSLKEAIHCYHSLTLIITCISTSFLAFSLFINLKSKWREANFMKQHGCDEPASLKYKWPFALDLVILAFSMIQKKQALQWFSSIFENTGTTFQQRILGARSISTIEPSNIESILNSNFTAYGLGKRRATFFPLLGDGIFTQEALPWKHSRDMLRPLFSLNRTNIFKQVEEHTEHLVNCIPNREYVDLQPLFFQFTFDTTTFLLFGKSMNSLQATSTQGKLIAREAGFSEAFRISQDYLFRRGRLGDQYWLIGGKEFRKNCSIVHQFIDEAIHEALSAEYQENKLGHVHSFLDALMKETRDPKVLRDQLLNVMLAGRDTTACCLTWTFRLLAQHPAVLEKLRMEIGSILGGFSILPDRNSLKKMRYLGFVLKEVLRLYPSVPINSRTALETTTLPTGGGPDGTKPLMIKKGEAVGYSVYVMHRLKELYGEDADSFRPERWDPEVKNDVDLRNIGYGYLPFNAGPRVCLGQEFALLEAGFVTVRILQRFSKLELHPDDAKIPVGKEDQEVTLVVASTSGCRVKASWA
ncbi:hypothetical protein HYFRA_00007184 [Hymenoscyphus fraxineus]|uniref:Cytochrome P450 n=1 Tax=Hymenoscyphus fraxineus TaxID=746836 RepID=A0A9N9KZ03_9HELO|nr:hypothetical protein HYFRA_00007184 [Hymenoscyphus fraxineus]